MGAETLFAVERSRPGLTRGAGFWVVLAALAAALLAYALTLAWYPDEAFHLVAAQLINAGQRPYLDFFHQHPPLYVYVAAFWMRLFGESWRSAHVLSTLCVMGSIWLVSGYVFDRLRGTGWERLGSLAAGLGLGLHSLVVRQATVGQPYALCMLLATAAFRATVAGFPFWAGLAAGGAAMASLLAAPIPLVLGIGCFAAGPAGGRWAQAARFLTGAAAAALPLLWLAAQGPRQVWFNLVEYHLFHRWAFIYSPVPALDLKLLFWLPTSSQGLLLLAGGIAGGVLAATRKLSWRLELCLCAGLFCGLILEAALARPGLAEYLVLAVPFLCLAAPLGLPALRAPARPTLLLIPLVAVYLFGPARFTWQRRNYGFHWQGIEELAATVNRLVPPEALLYAPESVYFATRRRPPLGLNNYFARLALLEPEQAAAFHMVLEPQLSEQLKKGRFDAVVIWERERQVPAVAALYARRQAVGSMIIFWERLHR